MLSLNPDHAGPVATNVAALLKDPDLEIRKLAVEVRELPYLNLESQRATVVTRHA
jgi:hypothetical protein